MATHDYVIANASGAAVRSDLNNALAAIVSNNSNATEPATTYAYMWWVDTTNGQLKQRNAANDDWIVVRELDGTMLMEDGTAAAPGLAFADDTDTGIYRVGANQLGISTDGTGRAVIDDSGRVLVGTTSTTSSNIFIAQGGTSGAGGLLAIARNNNTPGNTDAIGNLNFSTSEHETVAQIKTQRDSGTWTAGSSYPTALLFSTTADGASSPTERMRIDSNGNVGIGTTIPTRDFDLVRTAADANLRIETTSTGNDARLELIGDNTGTSQIRFGDQNSVNPGSITYDHSTNSLSFNTNSSTAVTINSGGDILFGTDGVPNGTSIYGAAFEDVSNDRMVLKSASSVTTGTSLFAFYNPNGNVGTISISGSSTLYNTSSDYRLKENVVPLTGAADRLNQLQVHRFNFIADPSKTVDGFLAHEAQSVVPECVTGEKDAVDADGNPEYQGIDQSKLVPLLTAALQEAIAKIETLETRIIALEGAN